jgi:LDH2 family malate/lactate/ureidoglycolate dehydrogenase
MNTSFSMLALDVTAFQPLASFEARMETMIDTIKSSRLAEEGGVILFPGERAQAEERRRRVEGIPLARGTFEALCARTSSVIQ